MAEVKVFEVRVRELFLSGMKKHESIREAMIRFPEAHQEYLERVKTGGPNVLKEALE